MGLWSVQASCLMPGDCVNDKKADFVMVTTADQVLEPGAEI